MSKATKKYYDAYGSWYDKERTFGYYQLINQLETELILNYARGKRILEVGCGTGIILNQTSKIAKEAIGVDLSKGMLNKARKKKLNVKEANALNLPFEDNSFDLVYSFKVLAHIPEIKKAILEIDRVLKRNGLAILEFYNPLSFKFLTNKIYNLLRGRKVYIRYDSLSKIKSYLPSSFKIIKIRGIRIFTPASFFLTLPLLSKIFRFLEKKSCDTFLKYFAGYFVIVIRKGDTEAPRQDI